MQCYWLDHENYFIHNNRFLFPQVVLTFLLSQRVLLDVLVLEDVDTPWDYLVELSELIARCFRWNLVAAVFFI
jgi:hypothetical protein